MPGSSLTLEDLKQAMRLLDGAYDPLGGMEVQVVPSWEYREERRRWWQLWRPRVQRVPVEPDHCLILGGRTVLCTERQKAELDRKLSPLCACGRGPGIYDGLCPPCHALSIEGP